MHKYLRAVGFSKIMRREEIKALLKITAESPTTTLTLNGDNETYCLANKEVGKGIGIRSFNVRSSDGSFENEYYFPYSESDLISSTENCTVERHTDRIAFGGIIDDPEMGISLIFFLSNGVEYVQKQRQSGKPIDLRGISLNALSVSGKILLPIYKSESEEEKRKAAATKRGNLIKAARNGDEEAVENLAAQDMNLIQTITGRIHREDIYSIVDTCFMPYGLESEQYTVIGEIRSVEKIRNELTGENCYRMTMECNNQNLTVTINEMDILGEPAVGRRFKGDIWLQGKALYEE